MVLCPDHHDQATKGAMPESEQRRLKATLHNISRGLAKGLMAVRQDYCAADFGSMTILGSGPFLRIAGEDIFGFHLEDGSLQISLCLYSPTDDLPLHIDRNEWISGDTSPWDVEADWQTLTLRERARHISVSINAKTIPMQVGGVFYKSGKRVLLNRSGITWGETAMGGMSDFAAVGMLLEIEADKEGCRLGPHKTHSHAMIINHRDHRERLRLAKDAWRKITPK